MHARMCVIGLKLLIPYSKATSRLFLSDSVHTDVSILWLGISIFGSTSFLELIMNLDV